MEVVLLNLPMRNIMSRTRTKGPIWKDRIQKVKGLPCVVRVFSGESDKDWEAFLNALPMSAKERVGPICPHYRTADGAFHWASFEWPADLTQTRVGGGGLLLGKGMLVSA